MHFMANVRLNFFYRLFEEHEELLNMFQKFQKLKTRDEQASSEELAEHAVSVMNSLDEGIRSIDNMDNFHLFLTQIGQSHCKIEGFQKEYFWVGFNWSVFASLLAGREINKDVIRNYDWKRRHKLYLNIIKTRADVTNVFRAILKQLKSCAVLIDQLILRNITELHRDIEIDW